MSAKNARVPRESTQRIDPDKVAEAPGLMEYAHHVGSALIAPLDRGRSRGQAMEAMYEQTGAQLEQLRGQLQTLLQQAQSVHDRIALSESIYLADVGFEPIIHQDYYLYRRNEGGTVLSMLSPQDWGRRCPYSYVATVRLLSDRTWEILERAHDEHSSDQHDRDEQGRALTVVV